MVRNAQHEAKLVGIGLDGDDGHVRVTKGDNFHIMGGSSDTHEQMQEKCIKFNEKLEGKGKKLGQLERNEFFDIAAECEMNVAVIEPPENPE